MAWYDYGVIGLAVVIILTALFLLGRDLVPKKKKPFKWFGGGSVLPLDDDEDRKVQ